MPERPLPAAPLKGRGTAQNPANRFDTRRIILTDGDNGTTPDPLPPFTTTVTVQHSRSILSRNDSPDIPFTWSINPYQGCEHGCIYCYARPSHAYLELSPGLDFETRLFAKPDAARLLRQALAKPSHRVSTINIGANTDPYQPIEREWRITRALLEVMLETRHPVALITKNALVLRDLDLLQELAALNLVRVFVSLTSLDAGLTRIMEPRASAPHRRLRTLETLAKASVPVGVMTAPLIPFINDQELERLLEAAANAGARRAGYVFLRLPHELGALFRDWLQTHFPLKAERVMAAIRASRGGKDNDSDFSQRMTGQGVFADLLRQRFGAACRRYGLNREGPLPLRTDLFRPPRADGQLPLFP